MGRAMARRVPGAGQFAGTSAAIAADEACDLGPAALTADGVAQGEHGVDVGSAPVHPGALEAGFDDQLVGTLDDAAADRKALGAEGGVLDLVGPAGEGDKAGTHCPCGLGGGRQRGHLATEFLEHRLGAARAEFLQLSLAPISLLGAIVEQVDQSRG